MGELSAISSYGAVQDYHDDPREESEDGEGDGEPWMGGKNITFFGSIALTVNNVSGPGMLSLPIAFQVRI